MQYINEAGQDVDFTLQPTRNLSLSPFNNEFAIDLKNVPNGTYLLNISDNAQTRTALFTLVR